MRMLQRCTSAVLKAMAVASLCAMSLVTVIDAAGRYLLNAPLTGSVELIELLMVALIFSSLPLVSAARGHISVDSIGHLLPQAVLRIQDRLGSALAMVISAGLAWVTLGKAASTADYGDMTPMLRVPLAPFVYAMAAALALDAIVHAANALAPARQPAEETRHD